jgi:hypothetical protein
MAALSIGTTALTEAQKATRIIDTFTKGSRYSQEVVDVLERDEFQGSGPLLQFLEQWKKDHRLGSTAQA